MKELTFAKKYVVMNSGENFRVVTYIGAIVQMDGKTRNFYFSGNAGFA